MTSVTTTGRITTVEPGLQVVEGMLPAAYCDELLADSGEPVDRGWPIRHYLMTADEDPVAEGAARAFGWRFPSPIQWWTQVLHYRRLGRLPWHEDGDNVPDTNFVSICAQLSDGDDYAGGHVEFKLAGGTVWRLPRARGTVAVFAAPGRRHRVAAVIAGHRWSLTSQGYVAASEHLESPPVHIDQEAE